MQNGLYFYSINMAVPIGSRFGSLELNIRDGGVDGFLTLFSETLPIEEGNCQGGQICFTGDIQTLMYPMHYKASGTLNEKEISLIFATDKGSFPAAGILLSEEQPDPARQPRLGSGQTKPNTYQSVKHNYPKTGKEGSRQV